MLRSISFPVIVAVAFIATVAAFSAVRQANGQAAEAYEFTFDKPAYFLDFDSSIGVTVTGVTNCAGQEVTLGVFNGPEGHSTASAVVDESGAASVTVPLVEGPWWAGISGVCVPGGTYIHDRVGDLYIDPVPPLPLQFSSEAPTYATGQQATVYVSGLGPCADQPVELGLFTRAGEQIAAAPDVLDVWGRGEATIAVETGGEFVVGVTGECVPDGLILSDTQAAFTTAPLPPSVGTGLRP